MIGKRHLNSLLCYPEVFSLKSLFKRTQDLKGFLLGGPQRAVWMLRGPCGEARPSGSCKPTVILCSNKDLGFNTPFRNAFASLLKDIWLRRRVKKIFYSQCSFNYHIINIVLANQNRGNFGDSLEWLKISILTRCYENVKCEN